MYHTPNVFCGFSIAVCPKGSQESLSSLIMHIILYHGDSIRFDTGYLLPDGVYRCHQIATPGTTDTLK